MTNTERIQENNDELRECIALADNLPEGGGGGVTSWNDLTDKPFGEVPGLVELMPETAAVEYPDSPFGPAWMFTTAPVLAVGETYTVVYNGAAYECVGMSAPEGYDNDPKAVALGNFAVLGGTNTGEPFAMLVMPTYQQIMAIDFAGATSVTLSIKQASMIVHPLDSKYLPEGVPCVIEGEKTQLMTERQLTVAGGLAYIDSGAPTMTAGKMYTIVWNGTWYPCMAFDGSALLPGAVGFGNLSALDPSYPSANTPFYGVAVNGVLQIVPIDGSEEITLEIWQGADEVRKIDPRCVDLSDVTGNVARNIRDGSQRGSLRTVDAAEESDEYTIGTRAFACGGITKASGSESHAEGYKTTASGDASHAEGELTTASGLHSHAEGSQTKAIEWASHAEGRHTKAEGTYSHAEGRGATASGESSHAEGDGTTASGDYSHAEGASTTASGAMSHAEGYYTNATNEESHAEGYYTNSNGKGSHSEGYETTAEAMASHTEGYGTNAKSVAAHAEGYYTVAVGRGAHAEGYYTYAYSDQQHVQGKYNVLDSAGKYAHIVGNGDNITRSNAHTLDWDGNAWFAGGIELTAPNGTRYRFTVDNNGNLSATAVTA